MEITFNTIKTSIKRHLSSIGKRIYNKEGKNIFADITASTAEDPILEQYIAAAAQNVETTLRQIIKEYRSTADGITIEVENTRASEDFDSRCAELTTSYITFFSVGEFLAMAHSELAEKYRLDAADAMQSLVAYAYHKEPPVSARYSYNDIAGSIAPINPN